MGELGQIPVSEFFQWVEHFKMEHEAKEKAAKKARRRR